jgi:hypothetical protein
VTAYSYFALSCVGSVIAAWVWDGARWMESCSTVDGSTMPGRYLALALAPSSSFDDFGGGALPWPPPAECCTLTVPKTGEIGLIVTFDAAAETDDDGAFAITTHASTDGSGDIVQELDVLAIPAGCKLVVDSAKRTCMLIEGDGTVLDGKDYLDTSSGIDWPVISQGCNYAQSVCIQPLAPCSGGGSTIVSVDTQHRRL